MVRGLSDARNKFKAKNEKQYLDNLESKALPLSEQLAKYQDLSIEENEKNLTRHQIDKIAGFSQKLKIIFKKDDDAIAQKKESEMQKKLACKSKSEDSKINNETDKGDKLKGGAEETVDLARQLQD